MTKEVRRFLHWPLVIGHFSLLLLSVRAEVTPASFRAAADYSAAHGGWSLLVLRDGATVFEEYHNGATAAARHKIYSGTKAFWVLATLAAVDDRLLALDERAADTLTEWRNDPRKSRITIRQLINCTSGLDPQFRLHGKLPDRNAVALAAPAVAQPGSAFTYGPSHYQALCEILRRKLAAHGATPTAFLERRILGPLGISSVEYLRDARGNPLLATGFRLTAREWARLGQLVLQRGKWNGRQLVRADLPGECLAGSRANAAFGPGFWLNAAARKFAASDADIEDTLDLPWQRQGWSRRCVCRAAPADLVACVGSGYQRLFIIPSQRLVIVRQGAGGRFSDAGFLRLLPEK
jgi:CubicO group peptidase (beta-lactamase class C family)